MIELRAPLSGKVWKVECKQGDQVQKDDPVVILEAMKMETELFAPAAGVVQQIRVKAGDAVEEDAVLLVIA
ncbi:MAG: biotin/lipoyl-containing protein [Thermodesulfobacteriota bacterium]|jgi:biotin carboxyl carrier protein